MVRISMAIGQAKRTKMANLLGRSILIASL